jgi:hypothetical protein
VCAGSNKPAVRRGVRDVPARSARAGGRWLVAVDGKTLKLAGVLHLTGAADITTALRHHAQRPHRPLQTLKTH